MASVATALQPPRANTASGAAPSESAAAALPQKHCPACGEHYPDDYAVCPRDAAPLIREGSGDDPIIGQVLGDTYEILRLLGEGGMGKVYEAKHVRLGRRFAIKLLHAHFSGDAESVTRFRREATAAAAIVSPNVAQVVDVHSTRDGRPYIVSELLEGEEFAAVLRREGPMEVAQVIAIARQVAKGLGVAHAAGVIHRDLKPENVMLMPSPDGRVIAKVLDFGIAKSIGDGSLTKTGVVLGTPAYMAPEQARSSASMDHRVDVYALGAVLYRALTGRAAFSGDDPSTTLTSVLYDEPERPTSIRRDLPDGLEVVIQRAMAKTADARYGSMAELDEALAMFDTGIVPLSDTARAAAATENKSGSQGDVSRAATMAIPGTNAHSEGMKARRARPRALGYALLTFSWSMLALASLIGAGIQFFTARPLGVIESILACVVAVVVTLPVAAAWTRDVWRGAWRNTAAMIGRADSMGTILAASFCAYALVSAGWLATYSLIYRQTGASRWAGIAALIASMVTAAIVATYQHSRKT